MQQLLHTGYTARTTASEIIRDVELTGKTVIITGGAAGLGLEAAKVLAGAGATVIVPARNVAKASTKVGGIRNVILYPETMDLSRQETVASFVRWFQERYERLDILINCAGIMAISLARDANGNELQISTNYVGHYTLTRSLLPQRIRAHGARVVNLSSRGHWYAAFNLTIRTSNQQRMTSGWPTDNPKRRSRCSA